jgi:hypothetical protein
MTRSAFIKACETILASMKTDPYTKSYAEMGIKIAEGYVPAYIAGLHAITQADLIRTQALYILNNIQNWREPEAKQVRLILKAAAKEAL